MSTTAGKHAGRLVFGTVRNRKDDPTQSGMVQVAWDSGAAINDQVDQPWTPVMGSTSNPSMGGVGGPHTGIMEGTRVVGIPLDASGQEFLVLGSMAIPGQGGPDRAAVHDSSIPSAAKVQQVAGVSQPKHGDVNGVVTQESIVSYAEREGGFLSRPARFASLSDSIGTLSRVIA